MIKESRIDILDSFRFLAILFVILFHYYSRWIPQGNNISLYPYGSSYNYFQYGYLGVEFFFILSGFCILYSLSGSKNLFSFWIKKLIRLFPPLLICSIITFLVFRILDSGSIMSNSHSFKNLLISLIFISPNIINHIFDLNRSYINGSYWFLWTEIQFYLIASFVYFVNRKHFIRNYTIFSLVTSVLNYSIVRIIANTYTTNRLNLHFSNYFLDQYKFWSESLDFLRFNYLFLIGIFLFILYEKKYKISTQIMIGAVVLLEFLTEPYFWNWTEIWIIMIIILLLLVFIYFPKSLKWISFKPLTSIGLASYSLYLIHENIGVLLINKYANSLGNYNFLFPVLLMILLMYFCYLGYKYIEKPLTNYLKVHFVK